MTETIHLLDRRGGPCLIEVRLRCELTPKLRRVLRRVVKGVSDRAGPERVMLDFQAELQDVPIRDSRGTIRYSHIEVLMGMGLMELDEEAYHMTYRVTERGRKVCTLLEGVS